MTNELMIAVVGLVGSLSGSIIGVLGSAKLLTYRISQLEQKFREQCDNCALMDGRVDELEAWRAVTDEKIKVANHRIDDLEKGAKYGKS